MNNYDDMNQKSNMIIYTTEDGLTKIETTFDEDTVWLSIDQMAELFQRDKSTISRHIKNVFSEGELQRESVVANFATTAADGKTYQVDYYNLDVIISVGYRVKSKRGTQFRIWATNILKEYMKKGFALDDERLKNLGGGGYFKELFYAVSRWNDWMSATIFLRTADLYPLQIFLREILLTSSADNIISTSGGSTNTVALAETIKYATIVISTAPILCIYPFIQRYFVTGVMIGGVKE